MDNDGTKCAEKVVMILTRDHFQARIRKGVAVSVCAL